MLQHRLAGFSRTSAIGTQVRHIIVLNHKEDKPMAETSDGKKKVYVHEHTKDDGTKVRTHYRSTPNTCNGKRK